MSAPRTSGEPEQDINCHCDMRSIVSDIAPSVRTWADGSQTEWQSYQDWLDSQDFDEED
jgi:hypothetical protein